MKISLIACTYNQATDLNLCLASLAKQSFVDFDILIADDGSSEETRAVVEKHKVLLGDRLKHVWHEDVGYRKALIMNKAIAELSTDCEWVIMIDADTLLHPRFVEDHVSQAEPRGLFMGRRVEMNSQMSAWVRAHPSLIWESETPQKMSSDFNQALLISSYFKKPKTENFNRSFRIENSLIRKIFNYDEVPDLLGSNFSICKKLLKELGGFDETLEHYWGEDGDLFIRALEKGVKPHGRKCWAVQYHLWHPRRSAPAGAEENYQARLSSLKKTGQHL